MYLLILINTLVIGTVVIIHYEFLYQLTQLMPNLRMKKRVRILFGVSVALLAHILEVWVFALAYYWMYKDGVWGTFKGEFNGTLLDIVYFSFSTYTTLGYGDIVVTGDIRYLVGIESLTGLVLITWTASFLFIEMQKFWKA